MRGEKWGFLGGKVQVSLVVGVEGFFVIHFARGRILIGMAV